MPGGISTLLCTITLCIGAKAWDEGPQIDVISLDLAKEFEQVPQNILLQNSCNFSISGSSLSWCADEVSNCQQQV